MTGKLLYREINIFYYIDVFKYININLIFEEKFNFIYK